MQWLESGRRCALFHETCWICGCIAGMALQSTYGSLLACSSPFKGVAASVHRKRENAFECMNTTEMRWVCSGRKPQRCAPRRDRVSIKRAPGAA